MAQIKCPKTLIQVFSENWLPHSCLFANCHSRGFISESGVVFNFVQRVSKCQDPLSHLEMIKASRKYRSVIHSWYLKILDDLAAQDGQVNDDLMRQSKVLHQMEISWHLCEILYINVSSAGTLLVQLLNWIKWHFTYYVKLADEMIVADLPQMHENYWDIIMFFALRGDMENAALLLELHSESKTDPIFMVVQDLLKKFPMMNGSNSFVIHEYYLRWGFWHDSVKEAAENQSTKTSQKRSHQQLHLLLRLLSGDLESFKLVSHLFHSWYQMMVSYALFTDPCLKGDVDFLIEKTMNAYYESSNGIGNSPTLFDKLILSAFNYDLIDVIKQSSLCFDDNWWFVTHFVDLIYNSARYADYQITDISLIRDSFVVNYANALFSHSRRFWQLSIEYLIHVGKETADSQQFILACLERVPFDSADELQRLLTTCRRFDFSQLELSLCRQQARKWLRGSQRKLGSAFFWAIRAKDKMLINHIVDEILHQYLVSDQNVDADIITNIGGSIVLSERLIFLCKYHEFRQLCQNGHYEPAAKILVDDMITSNAIPDFFQTKVIEDCFSLIQPQKSSISMSMPGPLQLNSKQICKIISSLEQVLYRARSRSDHESDQSTSTLLSDYFRNHGQQQQQQDAEDDESNQRRIQRIEKQLRVAAAYHLANHFVL